MIDYLRNKLFIYRNQLLEMKGLFLTWVTRPKHSVTAQLIRQYCKGVGVEIGPGQTPYTSGPNTSYLDKFPSRHSRLTIERIRGAEKIPRPDDSLDYIFSAHCLEHCPNTLEVLNEWKRTLKPRGVLFLILPDGTRGFDKGRSLTTLEHHIRDYELNVDYSDKTHISEFAEFSVHQHAHKWLKNARLENGNLDFDYIVQSGHFHFHVWTQNEIITLVRHLGGTILACLDFIQERPDSFLVVSQFPKNVVI